MPSAYVSPNSQIFLRDRWEPILNSTASVDVAGVNRHGKVEWQPIEVCGTKRLEDLVIVCSSTRLGEFAASTTLICSDGRPVAARQIVEGFEESRLRFESVSCEMHQPSERAWASLLTELRKRSPFAARSKFALRCVGGSRNFENIKGVKIISVRDQRFAVLDPDVLSRSKGQTFSDLGELLFGAEDEPGVLECEVSDSLFVNTLVSMWEPSIQLRCDSLQHTSTITVLRTDSPSVPYAQLRSSFFSAFEQKVYELHWSHVSWKPIVSGFLIAPSS